MNDHVVGRVLAGRYRIDKPIGAGGMGVVYEAFDLQQGRRVAVKTLSLDDERSRARFSQEALAIASLRSPHVVHVTDFRSDGDGPPFFVMELLAGESLATRLRRVGRLDPSSACTIAVQMLAGLGAAHKKGIIHRDVKPSNVFLVATSGELLVKILDFGVAKVLGGNVATTAGVILGTQAYLAPEQLLLQEVDARTDIHAVGACLYEMLAGRKAFVERGGELVREILHAMPPSLSPLGIPAELVHVVERALAKDKTARWPDAGAMARALEPFARVPVTEVMPPRVEPRSRARIFVLALGATLAVAAIGGVVVLRATRAVPRASEPDVGTVALDVPDAEPEPVAEDAGADEPEVAEDAASPVASAAPAKPSRPPSCSCILPTSGNRLVFRLCPTPKPPRCECKGSHNNILCGVPWRLGRSSTCPKPPEVGPQPSSGDRCEGYTYWVGTDGTIEHERTVGSLDCSVCYDPIPLVHGRHGEPCRGVTSYGTELHGRFVCDPR